MKHVLVCLFIFPFLSAQDQPEVALSTIPWAGDWLRSDLDQMVSGEEFLGYPGPLVKMYVALGMDADHPGAAFDRLRLVDREAPFWYGACNGWSIAATNYEEPETIVINGVKLFSSEVKALLSRVWKDTSETTLAGHAGAGLSAEEFHGLLHEYIDNDRPIIFDVTTGTQKWNYPVAGYTASETVGEEWTDVNMRVYYTNTAKLKDIKEIRPYVLLLDYNYAYRYSNTTPVKYEWAPGSSKPDRAWSAYAAYFKNTWLAFSNRFWNLSHYDKLAQLAGNNARLRDRYEPNQDSAGASSLDTNLVLAAVAGGDSDWFTIDKLEDEPFALTFQVYDGEKVNLAVYDEDNQLLADYGEVMRVDILLAGQVAGKLRLEVRPLASNAPPSFYHFQHDPGYSWYRQPAMENGKALIRLRAINVSDTDGNLGAEELKAFPAMSTRDYMGLSEDTLHRGDTDTFWVVEKGLEHGIWKRYYKHNKREMTYVVPQITCRNGWHTLLNISTTLAEDLDVEVFDKDGGLLTRLVLTVDDLGKSIDLATMLTTQEERVAAWFQVKASTGNLLSGFVTFLNDNGYRADLDLVSRPRNTEMILAGLPGDEGWVGLSLLNTSGVFNEVLYRLYNERGVKLESGRVELEPGQRWLGLPSMLVASAIEKGYFFKFFSQYDLESLVLRHHSDEGVDYAHRLDGEVLDTVKETVISLPDYSQDTHRYVFANMNNRVNPTIFEGYSAEGEILATFNYRFRPWQVLRLTLEELLDIGAIDNSSREIRTLRVTTSRALMLHELVGKAGATNMTHVPVLPIHRYP